MRYWQRNVNQERWSELNEEQVRQLIRSFGGDIDSKIGYLHAGYSVQFGVLEFRAHSYGSVVRTHTEEAWAESWVEHALHHVTNPCYRDSDNPFDCFQGYLCDIFIGGLPWDLERDAAVRALIRQEPKLAELRQSITTHWGAQALEGFDNNLNWDEENNNNDAN